MAGNRNCVGMGLGLVVWASAVMAQTSYDEYPADRSSYSGRYSGAYTATVTQGDRGGGRLGGAVTYSYTFDVPTRPPLTPNQCQNNTPVTGPNDCNRSCIKKDSYKRYLTGVLTGVPAIGVTPSCAAPISGALQNITLTEAYDACEAANAWGGETSSTVRTLVGPLFHFNNPRTEKTTTGGLFSKSTEWSYTNEAELLLPYVAIPTRVTITCLPRVSRLGEDTPARQDGGSANLPSEDTTPKRNVAPVQGELTANPNAGTGGTETPDDRGIETPVVVVVPVTPDGKGTKGVKKKKPRKKIKALKARAKAKAKAAAIKRAKAKAKAKRKKLKNQ